MASLSQSLKSMRDIVRFSSFYPLYLRVFRFSLFQHYEREKKFFQNLLKSEKSVVFDIGANIGDKSAIFRKYAQKVVAVEPDAGGYSKLVSRFFHARKVLVVNAAVGSKPGNETFYVNTPGSPANTLSSKWKNILEVESSNRWKRSTPFLTSYPVKVITLDNMIAQYGRPYFIKIDVEGYEYEALKGLSSAVAVISIEANLPEFRAETQACIDRINSISPATFNIIDDNFQFFWKENQGMDATLQWLEKTDLKYFEVFCFSKPGEES
jgi:FkbM family methyltransferase